MATYVGVDPMSGDRQGGEGISATLRASDGKGTIRLEGRFGADRGDLWAALTDQHHLARWLGEFEGDLSLGGTYRARYFASGWEGTGLVEACNPEERLLVRTTSSDGSQRQIEATLPAAGDETFLVIEIRGVPLEHIAAFGAGNQIHVEDLAAYLAGLDRCDAKARWEELHPRYQEIAAPLM
jgi:uncharacterized protein YndB with AHSA1/START domain